VQQGVNLWVSWVVNGHRTIDKVNSVQATERCQRLYDELLQKQHSSVFLVINNYHWGFGPPEHLGVAPPMA